MKEGGRILGKKGQLFIFKVYHNQLAGYLSVGNALLLKQNCLFEVCHGNGFACHRYIGFMFFETNIVKNHRPVA